MPSLQRIHAEVTLQFTGITTSLAVGWIGLPPLRKGVTDVFPNNLVYGYHGTTDVLATQILRRGFTPSSFSGDWLGGAIYFWENDAERAGLWAQRKASASDGAPMVIRATIDLTDCFDLTLLKHRRMLAGAAEAILTESPDRMLGLRQTESGLRELDCAIIDAFMESTRKGDGSPAYDSVRGAFQEGLPLFELEGQKSGIRLYDHIQIGVTDSRAIKEVDVHYA